MNIDKILSTKERIDILKYIIYIEKEFGVSETAKKLKLSKGLISKYFDILVKDFVLKKSKNKFLVNNSSIVKGIKILFNVQQISSNLFKKYKFIKMVGLHGSCAKGFNTENSDVDLWIKVDNANNEKIVNLMSELRQKIKNIKILILDDKKIKLLKKNDIVFYYSLYFGSIILYGEENEI